MFILDLAINKGKNNRFFISLIELGVYYFRLTRTTLDLPFVNLLTLYRRAFNVTDSSI